MIDSIKSFFKKYEERYKLWTGISAGLFLLQIVHLYWLTTHVVFFRLFDVSLFDPNAFWQTIIILVDYTEIPAIISISLLYIYSLRQQWNKKDFFLLLLLNTQWIHIFWISDEFVVDMFLGEGIATALPVWFAWVAIFIDYLELPVMYDVIKKYIASFIKTA